MFSQRAWLVSTAEPKSSDVVIWPLTMSVKLFVAGVATAEIDAATVALLQTVKRTLASPLMGAPPFARTP